MTTPSAPRPSPTNGSAQRAAQTLRRAARLATLSIVALALPPTRTATADGAGPQLEDWRKFRNLVVSLSTEVVAPFVETIDCKKDDRVVGRIRLIGEAAIRRDGEGAEHATWLFRDEFEASFGFGWNLVEDVTTKNMQPLVGFRVASRDIPAAVTRWSRSSALDDLKTSWYPATGGRTWTGEPRETRAWVGLVPQTVDDRPRPRSDPALQTTASLVGLLRRWIALERRWVAFEERRTPKPPAPDSVPRLGEHHLLACQLNPSEAVEGSDKRPELLVSDLELTTHLVGSSPPKSLQCVFSRNVDGNVRTVVLELNTSSGRFERGEIRRGDAVELRLVQSPAYSIEMAPPGGEDPLKPPATPTLLDSYLTKYVGANDTADRRSSALSMQEAARTGARIFRVLLTATSPQALVDELMTNDSNIVSPGYEAQLALAPGAAAVTPADVDLARERAKRLLLAMPLYRLDAVAGRDAVSLAFASASFAIEAGPKYPDVADATNPKPVEVYQIGLSDALGRMVDVTSPTTAAATNGPTVEPILKGLVVYRIVGQSTWYWHPTGDPAGR